MNPTRDQPATRARRLVSIGLLICALLPGAAGARGWDLIAGLGLEGGTGHGELASGGAMTAKPAGANPAELPRSGGASAGGTLPAPWAGVGLIVWGDGPTAGYADASAVLMQSIRVRAYRRRSIAYRRL